MSPIECPNCGREAQNDNYFKTGEDYTFCMNCGYYHSVTIKDKTKRLDELTDDDWEIFEIKKPFAAFRIKMYGDKGFIAGPIADEDQFNGIKKECSEGSRIEYLFISQFINNDILETIVVDNGPEIDSAGFSREDEDNQVSF